MSRRMLRQSEAFESAVRFSEERFHLAVVGSNDGLWEWDLRFGRNVHLPEDQGSARATPISEVENTPDALLELVHPDDRDGTLAAVRAHVRKGVPYDVEFRAPDEIRRLPLASRARSVRSRCRGKRRARRGFGGRHRRPQACARAVVFGHRARTAAGRAGRRCGHHDRPAGQGRVREPCRGEADGMDARRRPEANPWRSYAE